MRINRHATHPGVDGAELVGNMLAHLKGERPLDASSRRAWEHCILASVRRGESLDVSLGLTASGQRSLQTRLLHLKRDEQILLALAAVAVEPDVSTWARCLRLSPLVRSFSDREWRQARLLAEPLPDWPRWKAHIFRAMQTGISLPRSPNGLFYIAQKADACSQNEQGARLLASYL